MKVNRFLGEKGGTTMKRKKFRLTPRVERAIEEYNDVITQIMKSKRDLHTKLLLVLEQQDETIQRMRELRREKKYRGV